MFVIVLETGERPLIENKEKGGLCLICKEKFSAVAGLRFHFISKHKSVLDKHKYAHIQEQFYQGKGNANCKHCSYVDDKNKEDYKKFHVIHKHYDLWRDFCKKGNFTFG